RPSVLRRAVPSFRLSLEASDDVCSETEQTGILKEAGRHEKGYRLTLDCREYSLFVYTELTSEEAEKLLGNEVVVSGELFLFAEATNFGEFDLRSYYDALGILGGINAASIRSVKTHSNPFKTAAFRFRERMEDVLSAFSGPYYGEERALLFNDRSDLPDDSRDLYSFLGFYTLLSSSGFTVSLFGMGLFLLLKKRIRSRLFAGFLASLPIFFIGSMNGFSLSFTRALLLFLIRVFASVLRRKFDTLSAFSLAILLLILERPEYVLLDSFLYTIGLMAASGILIPVLTHYFFYASKAEKAAIRMLSFKSCFLPIQIRSSFRPAVYSVLTGFLLFTFKTLEYLLLLLAVLCGALFGIDNAPVRVLASCVTGLFSMQKSLLLLIQKLPFADLVNGSPSMRRIALYLALLGAFALVLRILTVRRKQTPERTEKQVSKRVRHLWILSLSGLVFFGILFLKAEMLPSDALRVTMTDVGQGDGFLIEAGGKTILIDGGSSFQDGIGSILQTTANHYGHSKIDAVFLSHSDTDHVSGIEEILSEDRISVSELLLPDLKTTDERTKNLIALARSKGIAVRFLSKGDLWNAGGLRVKVLWPEKQSSLNGNDASMVFSITFLETDLLFTGDISAEVEKEIEIDREYELLKIPHHGSKYSSSAFFLARVKPLIALISYGRRNPYGHPAESVLKKLELLNSRVYRTGRDGAVGIVFREQAAKIVFAKKRSQ
ncbi:MAG: ComEC family DNA internalization-related competence protein, partial [Lachnospiraceae bacterium]|nr:ComEC family DNA internalization-related competence protein [Lachnospiraceae bacterium]